MNEISFKELNGKLTVITGGAGVIGKAIGIGLASVGVRTIILDIDLAAAKTVADEIRKLTGTFSMGVQADVLDKTSLLAARDVIHGEAGKIDFLINGAGGNAPKGTTKVEEIVPGQINDLADSFFGLEIEGMERIFDLNFFGTLLPTMVFARDMIEAGKGAVLNISSLSAFHPLTKIPVYSAAKAAINNFTEWLAVHMAKTGVRVNAIAPGFFLTNQNRFLLIDEQTGNLSPRGEKIMKGTPMGRFGTADELAGTVAFLLSDMASYITGTVMLVDGGYNAYSGV
jgi:NAD(P)-dependent dehydrogenase (short-subunit alcohol dehydrogenase family)